ncbi:hypothetical protein [Mycobacterium hubeiense]|uniref:hypothetical protein n=1 Tax=Mycobacterium hubeiense TaxID=1867256 RepID=UPI001E2CAD75|nr:hypothetical protein [Mycobacterium sp. QGD 101]
MAQALAERVAARSVHVHGDLFRRWIVNRRAEMSPQPSPEALEQSRLRHRLTLLVCDGYMDAGPWWCRTWCSVSTSSTWRRQSVRAHCMWWC